MPHEPTDGNGVTVTVTEVDPVGKRMVTVTYNIDGRCRS